MRYVIRRLNKPTAEIGNKLFVDVSKVYTRTTGPLYSTWAWFKWALSRWDAAFIGHAEDDATIHYPILQQVVDATLKLSRSRPRLIFGNPEVYHWSSNFHSPYFWRYYNWIDGLNCKITPMRYSNNTRGSIYGPFPFMTGSLFFMDRDTTNRLLVHPVVVSEKESMQQRSGGTTPPWDDVFWGFSLSVSDIENISFVRVHGLFESAPGGGRGSCALTTRKMVHHKMCSTANHTHFMNLASSSFFCAEKGRTCTNQTFYDCRGQTQKKSFGRSR